MDIQQHMNKDVKTCSERESITSAAKKMAMLNIGCLIVISDDKPVGIFTERDLLKRVVAEEKDPSKTTVGDVMTREYITVDHTASVGVAHHICVSKNIRHIPVLKDGNLVGIVSVKDLGKVLDERFYGTYFGRSRQSNMSGDY